MTWRDQRTVDHQRREGEHSLIIGTGNRLHVSFGLHIVLLEKMKNRNAHPVVPWPPIRCPLSSNHAPAHRKIMIRPWPRSYLADLLDSPSMDATASIRNGRQRSEITLICARALCFFSGAMSDFGSAS